MDKVIEKDCREYLDKIDLSPLHDKTVLVTGANGLIGTYLIYMFYLKNKINKANINVIAASKSPPCKALEDIFNRDIKAQEKLKNNSNLYEFHSVDLTQDSFDWIKNTDYIIHGATYAQPGKFLRNYHDTIQLNTVVTEKLLKKAGSNNAKFLFLSSSEIYGEPDKQNIPTDENYPGLCSAVNVRAIYSESKRMGETLCFAYKNFEGVDAKIARISMTYGPGVKLTDERVLAQFLNQALNYKKIVMLDDGSKVRTFCYISDCVLMLLNILIYGSDLVYNVGGKDSITIKELAQKICELTGSTLSQDNSSQPQEQNIKVSPERVELDINKAVTEFRLNQFKPFRDGLIRTIEWNMENMI